MCLVREQQVRYRKVEVAVMSGLDMMRRQLLFRGRAPMGSGGWAAGEARTTLWGLIFLIEMVRGVGLCLSSPIE